jgi:hypothetical protein
MFPNVSKVSPKTLETLNPFMLREAMEKKLKTIFTALHLG